MRTHTTYSAMLAPFILLASAPLGVLAGDVLKTNGYNLEHNFGHGKNNLSAVFVTLNLLAFAFHTVCDLTEGLWRQAAEKMGSRGRFFENLRSITNFLVFPTWDDLLATLAFARPPPPAP